MSDAEAEAAASRVLGAAGHELLSEDVSQGEMPFVGVLYGIFSTRYNLPTHKC